MNINEQGQRFSFAYVGAVASVAGFGVVEPPTDDDSVDLTVAKRGLGGTVRSPRLDIQAKHQRCDAIPEGDLAYPLPIKNYVDLRGADFLVPRILVVVFVPAVDDNADTGIVGQRVPRVALRPGEAAPLPPGIGQGKVLGWWCRPLIGYVDDHLKTLGCMANFLSQDARNQVWTGQFEWAGGDI